VLDELIQCLRPVEAAVSKRIRQNDEYAACLASMFRLKLGHLGGEGADGQKAHDTKILRFFQNLLVGLMPQVPQVFSSSPSTIDALLNAPAAWLPNEISSLALQGDPACTHLMVHGKVRHMANAEWDRSFYPLSSISDMVQQEQLDPIAANFPIFAMMPREDISKTVWELLKALLNPASRRSSVGGAEYHIQVSVVRKLFDKQQNPFLALVNIRACILCNGTMAACCTSMLKLPESPYVTEVKSAQGAEQNGTEAGLWGMAKRQIERLWYGGPAPQQASDSAAAQAQVYAQAKARVQAFMPQAQAQVQVQPQMQVQMQPQATQPSAAAVRPMKRPRPESMPIYDNNMSNSFLDYAPTNHTDYAATMPSGSYSDTLTQGPAQRHDSGLSACSRMMPSQNHLVNQQHLSANMNGFVPNQSMGRASDHTITRLPESAQMHMPVALAQSMALAPSPGLDTSHTHGGFAIDQEEGLDLCKMIVNSSFSQLNQTPAYMSHDPNQDMQASHDPNQDMQAQQAYDYEPSPLIGYSM